MPPFEVLTMVRSAGLDPVSPAFRRGRAYVLRAIDRSGEEVRVVVHARRGEIVSVTPVRLAMRGGPDVQPRDFGDRPRPFYVDPEPLPRGAYRGGPPPLDDDDDERLLSAEPPLREPHVIPAPGPADAAVGLPPPPERFPQRVAPAPAISPMSAPPARPMQPPRRTASALPSQPPLPRPRPPADQPAAAPAETKAQSDSNAPQPKRPAGNPADQLPH